MIRPNGGYHKALPASVTAADAKALQRDFYQRSGVDVGAWPGQTPEEHIAAIRAAEAAGSLSPGRHAFAHGGVL